MHFIFPIEEKPKFLFSIAQLNLILGSYTIWLATGNAIYCMSIKASTLDLYLVAAATFVMKLDPLGRNPLLDEKGNKDVGVRNAVNKVRRVELVPNQAEAYTIAMHSHFNKCTTFLFKDSLQACLLQWFTVTLCGGCRRSKWCQPDGLGTLERLEMCCLKDVTQPKAFMLEDIEFFTEHRKLLPQIAATKAPEMIFIV